MSSPSWWGGSSSPMLPGGSDSEVATWAFKAAGAWALALPGIFAALFAGIFNR